MTDREPIDEEARDYIATALADSIFVEAGAGTGKSTTLVDRVVAMAADGEIPLRNIAAITFTEKAASELRDRIRAALVKQDSDSPPQAIRDAVLEIDSAVIGTIHGFALAILREHAVAAGLPLGFAVVGEGESHSARRGRARMVIEQVEAELPSQARQVLSTLGVDYASLAVLVEALDSASPRIDASRVLSPSMADFERLRADAVFALTVFIGESLSACLDPSDRLAEWISDRVAPLRDQLAGADLLALAGMQATYDADWGKVFKPGGIGKKAAWGSSEEAKAVRDRLKDCEPSVIAAISAPADYAVREVLAFAWQELAEMRKERASRGELEFDDLLILTRELLESPERAEVRKRVADRFRAVLVDEFQDTDPTQWRIIQLVTSDPADKSATPQSGRLMVVGDPKQAIYSFRGADITTYLDASGDFPGAERKLVTSFRSVQPLVDWLNAVFSDLFVASPFQPAYEELVAFHSPAIAEPPGPTVVVLADPAADQDDSGPAFKPRELEPLLVATAIRRAIDEGWQVTVPEPETKSRKYDHACLYRDVAILVPTRTGVDDLLDALDRFGVPFRTADAALVFARPAVSGLIAAVRALADPDDQLALWWALKSPLFGCGDDDLVGYRRAGGSWRIPTRGADLPEGIVSTALLTLAEVRGMAVAPQPAEVLNALINRCRLVEVLEPMPRGSFEVDCLQMLRADARAWQESGGVGLDDYLAHIDSLQSGQSRASLDEPDDREDDAVRIATIHGAKGLEYPVVVLAGMATQRRRDSDRIGVRRDGGIEFSHSDLGSIGYDEWKATERDPREESELVRLLYVGATRARDHLVVSVVGAGADHTRAAVLGPRVLSLDCDALITDPDPVPAVTAAPVEGPWIEVPNGWGDALEGIRLATRQPWVAAPSGAAAAALGVAKAPPASATAEEGEPVAPIRPLQDERVRDLALDQRDGRPLGRAVHAALDLAFRAGEPIAADRLAEICAEAAELEGIPGDLAQVVERVKAALATSLAAEALSSPRRYPELYLAAPVAAGGVRVVEGYADLVFDDGEGWVVVDHKTDATLDAESRAHYAEQLAAYAELLRLATGRPVTRKVLLHVPGDTADVVHLD